MADDTATCWDINALRLQADAAKYQLLQGLLRALATPPAAPTVDLMALLAAANGGVSGSQPAAGVDQQGTSRPAQYDGLLNLPALTSVPAATTLPAMSSFSGLLSSFGAGSALAGDDGLSSTTELGHNGASGSNMTAAMAPPLVAAKECNDGGTSTPCEDTPASSPFEGLENLNLDDEFNSDSWKDLLEQMSWLNNPNDQQQLM
ncbi:transcription factor MYB39-like [Panicum miliaceum]|uniref:Transcription factor MYB39-like n=1 Tax=Panicum miliaceum TaxID=4540 RepID=A0A3L6S043_PANMI|nr:transcription factor MYB39-like [Panicum miliaceum]